MLPHLRSLVLAVLIGPCTAAVAAAESALHAELDTSIARTIEHMFGATAGESDRALTREDQSRLSSLERAQLEQERQAAAAARATAAAQQRAAEAREALLTQRIDTMERLLLAQHEREIALYRDTIRLVTLVGGAFAGVCMIGLFAAGFLNYRALLTVQNMSSRPREIVPGTERATALLASSTEPAGTDRVRASGRRFQSRMSSLEQRLAELEHLTGRPASSSAADAEIDDGFAAAETATNFVPPPPVQVIPRALILVHKAQTLTNLGKLNDALATLDEATKFDATKPEVHLARGQVLEKMGRLGDALQAYDTAVVSDEQNASALLLKAGVLNRQERFAEALACYERALEVHRATT